MATAGSLVVKLMGDTQQFKQSMRSAVGEVQQFAGRMTALAGLIGGLSLGGSIAAAEESITAQRKLQGVITATGGAAGLTAAEISDYASELQNVTNFEDDATVAAAAMLAAFKQVKGDQFKEALALAQDLATVMETDLPAATKMLGKALQDPAHGLAALRKNGVSFTQQQIDQIEALQKSGDMLGAHKLILQELASIVGGVAKAAASPLTQMKNAIGEVGESLGKTLWPNVQIVCKGMIWLSSILQQMPEWIGGVAIAILVLVGVYKAYALTLVIVKAMSGPAGWAALGIGLTIAAAAAAGLRAEFDAIAGDAAKAKEKVAGVQKTLEDASADAPSSGSANLDDLLGRLRSHEIIPRSERDTPLFPDADEKLEKVQKLKQALEEIRGSSDLLTPTGVQNFTKQITDEIGKITGISKAIEDARQQIAATKDPAAADTFKVNEFAAKGATSGQILELTDLLDDLREAKTAADELKKSTELRKEGASTIAQLTDEIDLLKGAATETDIALREMGRKGFAGDQADQLAGLIKQRDALKEAKELMESVKTPQEKLAEKLGKIQSLQDQGLISPEIAARAEAKARKEADGDDTPKFTKAMQAGSSEAISTILAASRGSPNKKLEDTAQKQLAKQTEMAEGIRALKSGPGEETEVVDF